MREKEDKVFKKGISTNYRGMKLRSRWELYVCKLLLYSEITFMYEPQKFQLTPGLSYIPDFYIPQHNRWIEVKGSLSDKDRVKIRIFSKAYRLVYLGKEELKVISGKKSLNFLSSPDIVNYVPNREELERFKGFLK